MLIPFKNSFDNAKSYDQYANIVLYVSSLILVGTFMIKTINPAWEPISNIINSINCFFIVAYAVLKFITNNTFYEASIHKRFDFVDNSFDTTFSEENSRNYYSNDNIEKGIYKMAVNGFENCLFTYNIAKCMLKSLWLKNIIIALLFIFFGIFGYNNAFVLLIQLSLPLLLLNQAIMHTLFVSRIDKVFESYRRMFQDLKNNNNKDNKNPEIIINVIEYESTISTGCILLNSKIYNKLNTVLSEKWEAMKLKYEIK